MAGELPELEVLNGKLRLPDRRRDTTSRSQPQLPVPKAARRLRDKKKAAGDDLGQELVTNETELFIFSFSIFEEKFFFQDFGIPENFQLFRIESKSHLVYVSYSQV
jgi:hypothetical protein